MKLQIEITEKQEKWLEKQAVKQGLNKGGVVKVWINNQVEKGK